MLVTIFADEFSKKKFVLCCDENDELLDKIKESRNYPFEEFVSERHKIVGIINDFLKDN